MKSFAILVVAAFVLAGCSDKGGSKEDDELPPEIQQKQIERLEQLASDKHPRTFSFPNQQALPEQTVFFNDTLAAGGGAGAEIPDDDGVADAGGTTITYDLSDRVPVGQPVELRIKLKWWGNPGASADMDIFVDVPGTRDSYSPGRFDESMNWNIVTKFRVVNAVHIEGAPFLVGLQATNGKNVHPDGVQYSIRVDLHFAAGVFAPGVPYAITVPENATSLIFESEPVVGDEHITSQYVIIDPQDRLIAFTQHNDIATETLRFPTRGPGEYVLYAHRMEGGFLRVESDVPIPAFQARILTMSVTATDLVSDVMASPGAQGQGGESGTFDVGSTFPLDVRGYIRPSGTGPVGAGGQVNLNISSEKGFVHSVEAVAYADGETGRVGTRQAEAHERKNMASGTYSYTLNANGGAGMKAGYEVVGYAR